MTRFAALLAILMALALICWAFAPRRHLPWFRVASLRLRLRLRLHPGRGFACLPELWLQWGRLASFRESGRTRPGLPLSHRVIRPSSHSVYLGRAQYRHRLHQPIQENITIVGRTRSGKSGWLARVIVHFGGAVVSATTKPDLFMLTSGLRSLLGRPVLVFNPQRIGGWLARTTFRWDPVPGCEDEAVATRRATAFTEAVRTKGTEADGFWSEQAATQMPALFCAAALGGLDLRAVAQWVLSGDTREAERILRAHGRASWAAVVAQMRGPAEKTGATVRMVLTSAMKFMNDPALAECVLPAPGDGFDIPEFLRLQGCLYLIGEQRGESSPIAPLFACMVTEIHWAASQLGSGMRRGRLDPPLLLQLDEVTQICPIPVPSLLADSGGRGIMMIIACHGLAQLEGRWGKAAARSVLDTSNQIYVSGIQDPDTLDMVSRLCGDAAYWERGAEGRRTAYYPVATPAMIRRLPKRRALVLRGSAAPVITHLPMAWNDRRYRWARLRGRDVAMVVPAPSLAELDMPAPSAMTAGTEAWAAADIEAADSVLTADLASGRAAPAAPTANGNRHRNGSQNGRASGNDRSARTSYPWDKR